MVCTCNIRHPSPLRKFSTEVSGDADTPFYDIVIVGGGMAGGSLALALGLSRLAIYSFFIVVVSLISLHS